MNIFDGIDEGKKEILKSCLHTVKKTYAKNEVIFSYGDKITSICYIIKGSVQLSKDDYNGNKIIAAKVFSGESFAEAFVCSGIKHSKINAKAIEETEILFLDFQKVLSVCSNTCPFHKKLIENLIKIVAKKNLFLQERVELLGKKTLRERIMHFLNKEKEKQHVEIFDISYSRDEFAEYIGADRSALSRELSKMKKQNLIDYHKNSFKIIR